MFETETIYDKYLQYKEDMLDCKEIELRDLELDYFIAYNLYRAPLTSSRGCYKIQRSWWKIFGEDKIFCSFKY